MKKLFFMVVIVFFTLFSLFGEEKAETKEKKERGDKAKVEIEEEEEIEEKEQNNILEQIEELRKRSEDRDAEIESLKKELVELKAQKEVSEIKGTGERAEKEKESEKEEKVVNFKPYGFVELVGYANDAHFMSNDLLIYVKNEDRSTANMSVRNSRFGFDITLPYIKAVDFSAKFEIDFLGVLPESGNAEANVGMRLRHAYFKAAKTFKSDTSLALTAGQTWSTAMIPIFPNMVNPSYGWGSGNLWNRLPLAELEIAQKAGPVNMGLKLAAVKPITGASANRRSFLEANIDAGDASHWPSLQSQLYLKTKFSGIDLFWAAGGAYGREDYTAGVKTNNSDSRVFGNEVEVWVFNTALKVVHKYAELQGKYFIGENLDMFGFFGGSLIKENGLVMESMQAMGYWAEISLKPLNGLRLVVGMGGEYTDPKDSDPADYAYDRNDSFWISAFYTFFDHFTPGFQWQRITTEKNDTKLTGNSYLGSLKFTF